MTPVPTIRITMPDKGQAALGALLDKTAVGQAIAAGMDYVNEAAVRGIRERISGPGVRRSSRKGISKLERRLGKGNLNADQTRSLRLSLKQMKSIRKEGRQTNANIGVDSGTLRRSIGRSTAVVVATASGMRVTSTVGSNQAFSKTGGNLTWGAADIAASVRYAAVHEYGSSKGNIPARPYVWPEIEAREADYGEAVSRNLEQLWIKRRRQ